MYIWRLDILRQINKYNFSKSYKNKKFKTIQLPILHDFFFTKYYKPNIINNSIVNNIDIIVIENYFIDHIYIIQLYTIFFLKSLHFILYHLYIFF